MVGNALQAAALLFTVVSLFRLIQVTPAKSDQYRGWLWFSGAIWIWLIGQLMETYAEILLNQNPYGTVADSFWILGSAVILKGLYHLYRSYRRQLPLLAVHSGLLIAICSVLYVSVLIFVYYRNLIDSDRGYFTKFIDVVYPTLNLITIWVVGSILLIARQLKVRWMVTQWSIILAALFIGTAADLFWSLWTETVSFLYRFQDVLYIVNYTLTGLAVHLQVKQSSWLHT